MKQTLMLFALTAALLTPVLAKPVATNKTISKQETDLGEFTGKIIAIDTRQWSVTVRGHELQMVTTREKTLVQKGKKIRKEISAKTDTAKSEKEETKTFKVDVSCKIVCPPQPASLLSDLHPQDPVTVGYTEVVDSGGKTILKALTITKSNEPGR